MARVIFVNRFYWPEETATGQLLTELAEGLAAAGYGVTVITSPGVSRVRKEEHSGVRIIRTGAVRTDGAGLSGKARDWTSFFVAAVFALRREVRRGDVIVAMTDPPMLGMGAWLIARLRHARLIHWVQDIYPELAILLTRHRWLAWLRPLRNIAWRGANRCVTLGHDMADTLQRHGVSASRLTIIRNWAPFRSRPVAAEDLRAAWGLTGKFVVMYSGNLGRVHDIEVLAELADALRTDPGIALVVVGSGARREALQDMVTRRGLANVTFRPPVPRPQLAASLATADLHLVTLQAGCEAFVYPSKLYGIAACGRPVLFIGPPESEIARDVRAANLGRVAARHEVPAMAAFVRELAHGSEERSRFAANAARFAEEHDLARAVPAWSRVLDEVFLEQPAG